MSIQVDTNFINPFVAAAKDVLEKQAATKMTAEKPFVKKIADIGEPIDIAGIISLNGETFTGSIALCFPKQVFLNVYESMVGERHTEIGSEVQDAAGEILNIIYGQAKSILNQKGYSLGMAIPTVLVGSQVRLKFKTPAPVIVLPFDSNAGKFRIEIFFEPNGNKH